MNKYLREREELKHLYNATENRRLKYCAIAVIAIVIVLLLSIIIWIDKISPKAMLIMRGCAGFGAVLFVVIVGGLSYRVNLKHIIDKKK